MIVDLKIFWGNLVTDAVKGQFGSEKDCSHA